MLRLRPALALCFWCSLLATLHTPAFADEEAHLGPPQTTGKPRENLPGGKGSSSWSIWRPRFPSIPSIPSFPSSLLNWGSGTKDAGASKDLTSEGPKDPMDNVLEHSGSGEESVSTTLQSSTTYQGKLTSSTEIGTVSRPPTDTHPSGAQPSSDDTHVPDSYSTMPTSGKVIVSLHNPSNTNTPPQTQTHVHLPPDTAPTPEHSRTATAKPLPKENKVKELVPGPQNDTLTVSVPSSSAPKTTVPTALVPKTTIDPARVETTLTRQPFDSITPPTSPQIRLLTTTVEPTVSISIGAKEATATETQPRQTQPDLGFSEAKAGPVEEQPGMNTTTGREEGAVEHTTSQNPWVNSPTPGEILDEEKQDEENGNYVDPGETDWGERTRVATTTTSVPWTPGVVVDTDDWLSNPTGSDGTFLPDCNQERTGICDLSYTWTPTPPSDIIIPTDNTTTSNNQSNNPFLIPAPPMFVPLHSDWNSAMAAWGLAWEAHIYGLGSIFAMVSLASALNLLCLPLRCPSGCGYFALVSLFLLAAGCTRAFSLLYDAYGHQDRLPSTEASLLLYEAPFPCLTAAFGLVFLLLSMRSRMQLSYSAFQRPCFLACLVLLHFAAAFGPVTLLRLYQRRAPFCLFLSLISRGAFVALASFLSAAYFVFYCYVRADSKHIYHLNNTSPTPAERYNRCPFAESRDWNRAAATVCLSALFSLACAGLQLYAMLHALGLAGGAEVFRPWPWWAFQFSCRVCEVGVCLTLALVVAQPVYCSDHLPQPGSCWTELLAAKSPIIPGSYQWTLSQQEKLAICDTIGNGETECLPLYTLVDERLGSSLNGLDLLYHSNRALAYRDLDLDLDLPGSSKPEDGGGGAPSGGSSFASDSTADLRPPSPINLRRSIDEALFSEALFPMSLFSPSRPFRCSDLSLNTSNTLPNGSQALRETFSADPGLYRTSSCVEMAPQPAPLLPLPGDPVLGAPPSPSLSSSSSCSSPERWRGSSSSCSLYRPSIGGSSLVLCSSPEGHGQPPSNHSGSSGRIASSSHQGSHLQRCYHTLGSASQESLDLDMSSEADRSVQEEFISVCRQIDALSICSETIDL